MPAPLSPWTRRPSGNASAGSPRNPPRRRTRGCRLVGSGQAGRGPHGSCIGSRGPSEETPMPRTPTQGWFFMLGLLLAFYLLLPFLGVKV